MWPRKSPRLPAGKAAARGLERELCPILAKRGCAQINTEIRDAAFALLGRRLPITICRPDSKKPLGSGWSEARSGTDWANKRWTRREIEKALRQFGDVNLGLRLGPSSGLIDVEADTPEALQDYSKLFGRDLPVTPTFQSLRGPHRLFQWDERLEALAKASIKYGSLEIRLGAGGKAAHSLIPPSAVNGNARYWTITLDECNPAPLPDGVVKRIIAATSAPEVSAPFTQNITCVSESLCNQDRTLIESAIKSTVPTGPGRRYHQLFAFARQLKGIPALADADRGTLRALVTKWHCRALPYIATKAFDESWADFLNAWKQIRFPAGTGPLAAALEAAISSPLPAEAYPFEIPALRNLVALCQKLQMIAGDAPFYLACRSAGELLGVTHVAANRWIRLLENEGILIRIRTGTRSKASEFRYVGSSLVDGGQL